MTPELQKYYEAQFAMFGEQGWRDFIIQVEQMLDATDTISGVEDAKALHIKQGECSIMRWILAWEGMVTIAHQQLQEDDNGSAQDV